MLEQGRDLIQIDLPEPAAEPLTPVVPDTSSSVNVEESNLSSHTELLPSPEELPVLSSRPLKDMIPEGTDDLFRQLVFGAMERLTAALRVMTDSSDPLLHKSKVLQSLKTMVAAAEATRFEKEDISWISNHVTDLINYAILAGTLGAEIKSNPFFGDATNELEETMSSLFEKSHELTDKFTLLEEEEARIRAAREDLETQRAKLDVEMQDVEGKLQQKILEDSKQGHLDAVKAKLDTMLAFFVSFSSSSP